MRKDRSKTGSAEAGPEDAPRPPASIGLCALCRFVRVQTTKRGATYYRCGRADDDPAFMQYPPIPLLRCDGFDRV